MTVGRRSPKQLENRSAELAMRAEVADRSGGLCEMEVCYMDVPAGETHVHVAFGSPVRISERVVHPPEDHNDDCPFRRDPANGCECALRSKSDAWARCGRPATGPGSGCAHIWRRWKVGMHLTDDGVPLKFHPLVVLAACGDCHRAFDSRAHDDEVRPPVDAAAKAKALIEHTLAAAEARCEGVSWPDLSHY